MKLLPATTITYRSRLTTTQALTRLSNMVEAPTAWSWWLGHRPTKPYLGRIHHQTFRIVRVIYYTNSFLPRIWGTIESDGGNTVIRVKMRLHPLVVVFYCAVGAFLSVGMASLTRDAIVRSGLSFHALTPVGIGSLMALFIYAMTMSGFWVEARRSKADLNAAFESGPADL